MMSLSEDYRAVRRLPDLPVRFWWARSIIRVGVRFLKTNVPEGVHLRIVEGESVSLRVYRPDPAPVETRPGLLWFHGGGLILGAAVMDDGLCSRVAQELGITVVAANYRLAPEHPFPAAHDDAIAAWQWIHEHAAELGLDTERVAIGGGSAGGCIAAGLVLRIRDEGLPPATAQWLFAPMLDDRTGADRRRDPVKYWVWNNKQNRYAWGAYLDQPVGAADVPAYAAPARAQDLSGLPPTWISVGEEDLFFDEDTAYARRITQAGGEVELVTLPGAPHGLDAWVDQVPASRRLLERARGWLGETLGA